MIQPPPSSQSLQHYCWGLDIALLTWFRKSKYTADRAGLPVCGDLDARRAMIKLCLGSKKLFDALNLDEYMKQLEELEEKVGNGVNSR